jgi:hypothetical protein
MQISGVSLTRSWPPRLCLLRVLQCASHCYKLSPFQAHFFLRPACLFTVHVGGGSSPLSCGVFLPSSLSHAFSLLVAGLVPLLPPSQARPGLFIYSSGRDSPPPPLVLRATHPLCYVSLLFLLLITQFLFFPGWGGWSVQGAMLIWPRVVCGSTAYHLAHLVRVFPSHLGVGVSDVRIFKRIN